LLAQNLFGYLATGEGRRLGAIRAYLISRQTTKGHIWRRRSCLRKSLYAAAKRRKQAVRYVQFALKFVVICIEKIIGI
jgi:hypothetical protein